MKLPIIGENWILKVAIGARHTFYRFGVGITSRWFPSHIVIETACSHLCRSLGGSMSPKSAWSNERTGILVLVGLVLPWY